MNGPTNLPLATDRGSLREIAEQLLRLAEGGESGNGTGSLEIAALHRSRSAAGSRATKAPLPDPRLVRRIIRNRQARSRHFDPVLFADPAWDMLLDLTAARAEHQRVSVTSLCIASGVPPTTALRWIGEMVKQGSFVRVGDQTDRRRAFVELSDRCADAMASYFAETGTDAHR